MYNNYIMFEYVLQVIKALLIETTTRVGQDILAVRDSDCVYVSVGCPVNKLLIASLAEAMHLAIKPGWSNQKAPCP